MPPTVLLVDDEPHVLSGLQRALRREPYTIICTSSVAEALTILRREPIQVVISDQDMPEMNGIAFLEKVSQEFPDTLRFILTGKSTLHAAEQAMQAGAIGNVFTKPCNRATLSDAIRQGLAQKDLPVDGPALSPTTAHQLAELDRIAHQAPELLAELLAAFPRLQNRKEEQKRAPVSSPPVETTMASPRPEEFDVTVLGDMSFTECLRQLGATAGQEYPVIIQVQRTKDGFQIVPLDSIDFEPCCRQCRSVAEVSLFRIHTSEILRATLVSLDASYLVVDIERTTTFYKKGKKLLAIFSVPPQGYYVWLIWIDTVYLKRFKLRYRAPS
jgi:DNA-binding NarL/FixJ family response regulator